MSKPHQKKCGAPKLEPRECQSGFLYGNEVTSRSPVLSKDTLYALEELGDILRGIHKRMISEGYEIKDGRIQKVKP